MIQQFMLVMAILFADGIIGAYKQSTIRKIKVLFHPNQIYLL